MQSREGLRNREAPLEMSPEEFRAAGHDLVDRLSDFLGKLPQLPVTRGESPTSIRDLVDRGTLPETGSSPGVLLEEASNLLFDHSLFNGHPRFWGYITSSPAPIGALADMLAAVVNPNVGACALSPVASAIESETVRWIAELIGYPAECGGLMVSGGNMANFIGFLAARRAKSPWDIRAMGVAGSEQRLRMYTSSETHTWVQKAADLFGLGTDAIRWIPVDEHQRIDIAALRRQIAADESSGDLPFLVVGTARSVSTGATDPLPELAAVCREYGLWFHVDGAYGALAACLSDAPADLRGLADADSVAVDPHKWLYAPLEAGCALVRDRDALRDAFSYHPVYYHFDDGVQETTNYYKYGPQNSRGFRALKVWLSLRQAGREGYERMISDDIHLARKLYKRVEAHPQLDACSQNLSITTFRYVPEDLEPGSPHVDAYLNKLNTELLERLQRGGEAFVSNAVMGSSYVLRACIVNFRTMPTDIEALPAIIVRLGLQVDRELRPRETLQ